MVSPPAPKLPAGAKVSAISGPPQAAVPAKNNTPKSAGRPTGKKAGPAKTIKGYSQKNIQNVVVKAEQLRSLATQELKNKFNTLELNENQLGMVDQLCEAVICATEFNQWENELKSCVNDINKIQDLDTLNEILDISGEHELTIYPSAILYHSEKL
jgi:hypothetical protein